MTRKPKRETAQQRDERIVAEAGPWLICELEGELLPDPQGPDNGDAIAEAIQALVRHANRLRRRKGGSEHRLHGGVRGARP